MLYEITLVIGLSWALGTMYFVGLVLKQCYDLRAYKGPIPLPFVGNCYTKESLFLLRFLSKLRKRYGRIFTFFALSKPYLVVCEPLAVRRILSDTKSFPKGKDYSEIFSIAFGEGLVTSMGEKHKKDRAAFGKFFVRSNVSKFMGKTNEMTVAEINATLVPQIGKPYNIEEFFAHLSMRVFMQFSCSIDLGHAKEKELAQQVSDGSFSLGRMITLGLPPWEIIPMVPTIRKQKKIVGREAVELVKIRKAQMEKGETDIDDCITAMIEQNMTDKDIEDHFVTLMAAGHDTTAFFSAYMCYLLSCNQDVQDKLRDEIIATIGDRTEFTADDVTDMKYLSKVMQETLRLYAIIPCVTRACIEDVYIKEAEMTIPKDANILIPMFLINRDPELWENPSQFNPDRFEGKGNEFTSAKNGFFPFGYGSRTCIGNTLAQLESAVFMCQIMTRYKMLEDTGFKPIIFAGISLTTSNGINVVLKEL